MSKGARNSSNVAAVFFDLDNTLIATRHADKLACNKLTKLLWEKFCVPPEDASAICTSYLKSFRKCPENPNIDLRAWRLSLWSHALGEKYQRLTEEIYHHWLNLRFHYLAIPQDVKNLLKKLRKHYYLALITNGPSRAQWEKIKRLDVESHFDMVLVSGDLPWEKPHHRIFHKACEFLGVQPAQCIMVGDKLETDIKGAIDASLGASVWVPLASCGGQEAVVRPDFTIKSVLELPNVLSLGGGARRDFVPEFDDCSNGSDGS